MPVPIDAPPFLDVRQLRRDAPRLEPTVVFFHGDDRDPDVVRNSRKPTGCGYQDGAAIRSRHDRVVPALDGLIEDIGIHLKFGLDADLEAVSLAA